MRRVLENDLNMIRLYRSGQMQDARRSFVYVERKAVERKAEGEMEFSQMLNREIRALSLI